ncbi:MAG TPA: diacylglycerol kinase [Geobacteraceae bacterium]|nr:diacylglycerol kinase [Geobacteraceae bacterium]
MKPTRFIDSINCAIEGILYAAKTQKHMRNHFLTAIALLLALLVMRVSALEFTLIAISVSFVLFAELVNTAIEVVVDLVSPEFHPLAKLAKDVSAGAVLIATIGATVMGYLILSRYLFPVYKEALGMIGPPTQTAMIVSMLIVIITVVILKSLAGKGTPLEGGIPSGHSAMAFSIATIVSLTTTDPVSSVLTLALAVMVSNSRLVMRLHTLREVIFGAILGTVLTLGVMLMFKYFT